MISSIRDEQFQINSNMISTGVTLNKALRPVCEKKKRPHARLGPWRKGTNECRPEAAATTCQMYPGRGEIQGFYLGLSR